MFGRKQSVLEWPVVEEPIVGNVIEEMARTATAVFPLDHDTEGELERLAALDSQLLPVEDETKKRVTRRIETLRAAKELPYQKLSLDPLAWRKDGRPIFALYSLDSPNMWILPTRFWIGSNAPAEATRPELPAPLSGVLLKDVTLPGIYLRSTFTGLIPTDVRTEIAKARPLFDEKVYILAEANWEAIPVPKGDPLIVGWRANALWLIAKFDTTDLETYMVSEFPG